MISTKLPLRQLVSKNFIRYFRKMRFVQFLVDDSRRVGVELHDGGEIVDVSLINPDIPRDLKEIIVDSERYLPQLLSAVDSSMKSGVGRKQKLTLKCPITNPEKILCVGMNYVDHCLEQNVPVPTEPVIFSKFNNSLADPTSDLIYPEETEQLDWEVELAIVIGKKGFKIKKENAMDHVFGYTVAHDVSARDWQFKNGGQFLLGKSMDGFCPLGPAIVTKDSIKDPHNLHLWTKVNGVIKQDSNTNQLVFKTDEIVEFISRFMHLTPGDIILTGTPPGVGVFQKPQVFLKVGDEVEVGIEGIGTIKNKIVASS